MHLLTNKRYITYQTGFSLGRLGHAHGGTSGYRGGGGGGGGGGWGVKNFSPKIQPDLVCDLLT